MNRALLLSVAAIAALAWIGSDELEPAARVGLVVLAALVPGLAIAQVPPALEAEDLSRRAIYFSSVASVWLLGLGALAAGLAGGFSASELFLAPLPPSELLGWGVAATLAGLALMAVARALRLQESPLLRHLLPRSTAERIGFVGVSVSAGIGEELAFRAFLVPALAAATGSLLAAVLLGAALFGVAHAYQRPAGAVRAGLLGLLLTVPMLATGSVLPSMLAHAALDLVAGLWLADWLLRDD